MDLRQRCNACGSWLPEPRPEACPTCQADLRRVGSRSELDEWAETRRMGRRRYIWSRGVLMCGGLMALGMSAGHLLNGSPPALFLFIVPACLLTGYFVGWAGWASAERQFAATRRHTNRLP